MYINDTLQVAQKELGNIAASGPIGTAAATVDQFSDFRITQTTTGVLATLPTPTDPTASQWVKVTNAQASTQTVSVNAVAIAPGQMAIYKWDSNTWNLATGLANIVANYWTTVTAPTAAPATVVSLPVNSPSRRAYGAAWLKDGELWAYGQEANGTAAATGAGFDHNRRPTSIPHYAQRYGTATPTHTPNFVRMWSSRYGHLLLDDTAKLWYRGWNNGRQSGIAAAAAGSTIETPLLIDFFQVNGINIVDAWLSDGDVGSVDYNASCYAITSTGAVYAWGYNGQGQLGIGNTTDQATPVLVGGLLAGKTAVKVIAYGSRRAAILTSDGNLYMAGYQPNGEIGIGNATQQNTWVLSKTGVANVFLANGATFVIDTTGKVWSTGFNSAGWFGRGNTTSSTSWLQSTSFTGVASRIFCNGTGRDSIIILDTSGNIWVGGDNVYSQLGLGGGSAANQNNHTLLTAAQAPFQTKVKEVHCAGTNGATSFVITTDGQLWSCGYNGYGQRGLGNRLETAAYRSVWYRVGHKNLVQNGAIFGYDDSATLVFVNDKGNLYFTGGWDAQQINPLAGWSSAPYQIQ